MAAEVAEAAMNTPIGRYLRGINATPRHVFRDDLYVDHRPVRSGGLVHAAFTFCPGRVFIPGLVCEATQLYPSRLRDIEVPTVTEMPVGAVLTCLSCVAKYA